MKELTVEQIIIYLVKSAIAEYVACVPENVDWKKIFTVGKTQKLIPLICRGIEKSSIELPDDVQSFVDNALLSYFMADQRQMLELSKIQKAFEENSIEYMPVKGMLLKPLYPETDLRPMGDGDILIRMSQKEKAFEVMDKLGFKKEKESPHEYIYIKDNVCVELHKCLVPPYNKDLYSYYGDGWRLANKDEKSSRHSFSDNDHFVYLFTHFAKHYRDGGISALHIVDFWVYKHEKSIDENYVRTELEKLGLVKFYDNIMETMNAWFGDAKATEMTEFITKRIFENGTWGTKETKLKAAGVRASKTEKNVGLSRVLWLIFPSTEKLQYRFPILQKHKYLLPVMWVVRWFDVLLFKRKKIHDRVDEVKLMDEEFISSYQKELDYVGLDFDLKE